jgi:putative MATE family efflux protein
MRLFKKSKTGALGQAALIDGSVHRTLLSMTFSMLIGLLAMAAFNVTDTYFVGLLGTTELAAMSFTFPVAMVVGGLARGLGVGVSALVSQKIGQGRQDQVQRLTTDSILLSLAMVGSLIVLGLLTIRPLFTAMGATAETLPLVEQYMRIWYPGMIFLVIPMVGNNAIRATGDTLSPSIIMTIDLLLNAILDPFLIFGIGPFPAMGIAGAALATVVCRALALAASLYVLHFRKHLLRYDLPSVARLKDSWKHTLALGLPPAGSHMLIPVAMGVVTRIIASFGAPAVAAFGVGIRVEMVAAMPLAALGLSTMPFVGQNWGARQLGRIHQAHRVTRHFALYWGAICMAVLALGARPIAGIFSSDPEVVPLIVRFLWIAPLAFAFKGLDFVANGAMNAIGKPMHSVAATLLRLFVLMLPLTLLGARLADFTGAIVGLTLGQALSGAVATGWIHWLYRVVSPQTTHPQEQPAADPEGWAE